MTEPDFPQEHARLEAEMQAVEAETVAVRRTLDKLSARPALDGPAVEAVRREEQEALRLRIDAVGQRERKVHSSAHALRDRLEAEFDHYLEQARQPYDPGKEPGLFGWVAQRHWAFGLLVGLVFPVMWVVLQAISYPDARVKVEFYNVAAQVIPVLVLAVALEGRILQAPSKVAPLDALLVGSFVWVIAGEVAALVGVAQGSASSFLFGVTTAALYSGTTMLVMVAINQRPQRA